MENTEQYSFEEGLKHWSDEKLIDYLQSYAERKAIFQFKCDKENYYDLQVMRAYKHTTMDLASDFVKKTLNQAKENLQKQFELEVENLFSKYKKEMFLQFMTSLNGARVTMQQSFDKNAVKIGIVVKSET